ncbi:MAG: hypothetical protein JXB15_06020 [Anaerolineales bacterium]|nr:hypothetical protein [Anaerolineales bacterium]
MLRPEINYSLCQSCNPCEARLACKTRAIIQIDPGDPPYIELGRCTGCADCVAACNFNAIRMCNSSTPGGGASGCAPHR